MECTHFTTGKRQWAHEEILVFTHFNKVRGTKVESTMDMNKHQLSDIVGEKYTGSIWESWS